MFSALSSFLPPVLQGEREKPTQKSPVIENISPPQPIQQPNVVAENQGAKRKKERTHESFIIVRPPPSKSNHPLNLQVQLVPPTSRTPVPVPSRSFDSERDTDNVSLSRTTSNRSDVSGITGYSSVTSFSSISTTSTTSGRRMIIPLYNLQAHNVMTNVIVDAGTDAKIARFIKRGLEVIGLAVFEPVEVCGGARYEDGGHSPGNYPTLLSPDPPYTPTSSHVSLHSDAHDTAPTPVPPPAAPPAPVQSTPQQERSGARRFFGRVFRHKENAPTLPAPLVPENERTSRPVTKRASLLVNAPTILNSALPEPPVTPLQATVLGVQPTLRSPSPAPGLTTAKLRPTSYVWVVRRWLKGPPESVSSIPVDQLIEVRFDWTRAGSQTGRGRRTLQEKRGSLLHSNTPSTASLRRNKAPGTSPAPTASPARRTGRSIERERGRGRERSHSPGPTSIHTTTTSEDGSPHAREREDEDESDPEDSETPWTCHLVVRRLHHDDTNTPEVRVKVAAVVPAPHHPKVVALLKVPFPLPDLMLSSRWDPLQGRPHVEIEARKRTVTPAGVARPADLSTNSSGQSGVAKFTAAAGTILSGGKAGFRNSGRPGTASSNSGSGGNVNEHGIMANGNDGEGATGVLLSAEEIKDAVCCTGLWVVVREGFGGVGRVSRKGDGWRIRG